MTKNESSKSFPVSYDWLHLHPLKFWKFIFRFLTRKDLIKIIMN